MNITQCTEDGFEKHMVIDAIYVNLSAAYDKVNHWRLLTKIYNMTKDHLIWLIQSTREPNVMLAGQMPAFIQVASIS